MIIKIMLVTYAVICVLASMAVYDIFALFGLKQVMSFFIAKKNAGNSFLTKGILGYVRHPLYSAGIALALGMGTITDVNVPVRLIMVLYFVVGAVLEEKKIIAEFGDQYLEYREKVPMLVPWKLFLSFKKQTK